MYHDNVASSLASSILGVYKLLRQLYLEFIYELTSTSLVAHKEVHTFLISLQCLNLLPHLSLSLSLQQVAIVTQIRNFIDTHQVVCAGPFVYAYVEEVQ